MANIDLPLILVIATFVGTLIYLFDTLVLKRKRKQDLEALKAQYPDWNIPGSPGHRIYEGLYPQTQQVPVWVRETKSFLPIIVLVLVVRSFIVEPFQIPSSSMEPSLDIGDFILVNKFTYGLRLPVTNTKVLSVNQPQRGEVMVFFPPNDPRYFIKRVIGLPGDYIEYRNKVLYVNGIKQEQISVPLTMIDLHQRKLFQENLDGVKHSIFITPNRRDEDMAFVVRDGHYFMMGDNRDNSSDSRVWGQVPEENIVGKAFFIWMHWKSWTSLPSFGRVGSIQ